MKGLGFMEAIETRLSPQEWEDLYDSDPAKWKNAYLDYICNPNNVGCCDTCPENHGYEGKACGQQNCWVTITTN
jgi:hypothetical protein